MFNTKTENRSTHIDYNAGLRQYLILVFNYLAMSLVVSGLSAYFFAISGIAQVLFSSFLSAILVQFSPLIILLIMNYKLSSMNLRTMQFSIVAFAIAMGLSSSYIFLVYTGTSIAKVFFMTASVFGAMSLYGYTTKKDLSKWGSFLIMGIMGILIVSLFNIFLRSSALDFAISFIVLIIFMALTAYDMQRIKSLYYELDSHNIDNESIAKIAAYSSINLFINFINIFRSLLYFFGDSRD